MARIGDVHQGELSIAGRYILSAEVVQVFLSPSKHDNALKVTLFIIKRRNTEHALYSKSHAFPMPAENGNAN